ncbi:MAG: type II toxin-antitoxin system VapC family toxin [Actinomycetota bacterium]
MLVVDTSAVLEALVGQPGDESLRRRLAEDGDLHAPHLIDVEMLHALRRLEAAKAISTDRATDARSDFQDLALVRYPHLGLSDRAWGLRRNFTAYDAMFVALAEELEATMITCDARLAKAASRLVEVEVYPMPKGRGRRRLGS